MSKYIDVDKIIKQLYSDDRNIGKKFSLDDVTTLLEEAPTADVVSREQFNSLYEQDLKLKEELNNLAGEDLPWVIVSVHTHNKGESPYRYHCPHCGYSHKKASHYRSNCGRRCKE